MSGSGSNLTKGMAGNPPLPVGIVQFRPPKRKARDRLASPPVALAEEPNTYSLRSTSRGFLPKIRKLESQPAVFASRAVATTATAFGNRSNWKTAVKHTVE